MGARRPTNLIFATLVGVLGASAAFAGDLNPPAGPIEPTMKPLDALLSGRCVSDLPGSADAEHVITEPGLYVLTADIVAPAGKSAIVVDLNAALAPGEHKVSIDLAGYDLLGDPASLHGIEFRASPPGVSKECDARNHKDIVSRIAGFGGDGIRCEGDTRLSVSGLHISVCGGHGIECIGSSRALLSGVEVSACTGDGLHMQSVARVVIKTKGTGADKDRVSGCGGNGVFLADCDDVEISGLRVSQCQLDGLHIQNADECRLSVEVADCDGDGLEVATARKLKACCLGSSGEDGVPTRFERCNGNGMLITNVDEIELSAQVALCLLDGVHIENADVCSVDLDVADCDGDGLDVFNARKLKACCLGSTGEDGVEVHYRVARCDGNGLLAVGVDVVDLTLHVDACLLDGAHVQNALECSLGGTFIDCGDNGIDGSQCGRMAIGTKGMVTSKPKKGNKTHRVVASGGHGVLLAACAEVVIDDLECTDTGLDGVRCDASGVAGDTSVSAHSVSLARCGGDGLRVIGNGSSLVWPRGIDVDSVVGDGLHVEGASVVEVSDWRDNDCDDGIDVRASAVTATHVRVDGALSVGAGSVGLRLLGAVQPVSAELVRVTVRDAFGNGIDARNNLQLGSLAVEDCAVSGSGGDGVSTDGCSMRIRRGAMVGNTACGVRLTNAGDVTASGLQCDNNGQEGMRCAGGGGGTGKVNLQDFHFTSNGGGAPGGAPGLSVDAMSSISLQNGECRSNTGAGLRLADFNGDGRLDLVVCSSNVGHGVHMQSSGGLPLGRCRVTNTMCDNNGGDGVSLEATTGGEVSRCTVTNNNGLGISVFGNGHVVVSNTCTGNLGGPLFVPVPGNVVGPVIDEVTIGGNCNPAANYVY